MSLIKFEINGMSINATIDPVVNDIIPKEEFPLKFKVERWTTNEVIWECDLYPGHWASFGDINYMNFSVVTKSGLILKEQHFHPTQMEGYIEEFFNLWISTRPKTNGIVLGAGTGMWGEWVYDTYLYRCNVLLVEGDPKNISLLKENFKTHLNVNIESAVISPNGGKVKFYVSPDSIVSSISLDNIEKYFPNDKTDSIEVMSKTVDELIERYFPDKIDWIRIDLEGIDYDVIMNINDLYLQKMSMLIYEALHLTDSQIEQVNDKLRRNGFNCINRFNIDIACTKI